MALLGESFCELISTASAWLGLVAWCEFLCAKLSHCSCASLKHENLLFALPSFLLGWGYALECYGMPLQINILGDFVCPYMLGTHFLHRKACQGFGKTEPRKRFLSSRVLLMNQRFNIRLPAVTEEDGGWYEFLFMQHGWLQTCSSKFLAEHLNWDTFSMS